jgi:hypothetical protein
MKYILNPSNHQDQYDFSYKKTKHLYEYYNGLSDEDFIKQLPDIIHFTCFVSWVKELEPVQILADNGLIHELTHLLSGVDPVTDIKSIREDFETLLKLA